MDDENEPVVIDNGSGLLKAGFADDDAPKHVFPTVIGTPKGPGMLVGMDQKDCYIGKEAISKQNHLELQHPVQ
jgi:actin